MRELSRVFLFWGLCFIAASATVAQEPERQRKSMEGLKAVCIQVDDAGFNARRMGLNPAALEKEIRQQLGSSGLRVDSEALECLRVRINAGEIRAGSGENELYLGYAAHLDLMLVQPVSLLRSPLSVDAVTWMLSDFVHGRGDFSGRVRKAAGILVEGFISEYRAANRK